MDNDILKRVRDYSTWARAVIAEGATSETLVLVREMADRIEALEAKNAKLKELLEKAGLWLDPQPGRSAQLRAEIYAELGYKP